MSVGAILTVGLGQFGTVNLLPTLGYLSSTTPIPVTVRSDGDDKKRRKRERDALERYRLKQLRLRDQLADAYAEATGEILPAQQILELPRPPAPVRALATQLRRVTRQIAALPVQIDYAAMQRAQDDEDAMIILMLLH